MSDLILAAKNGYLEEVKHLLDFGESVHARDQENGTPLYWSACRGYFQICKTLIEAGSDIHARVTWGSTPLHAAADRGHAKCVQLLINCGATVSVQNSRGDTPLHLAAFRGYSDIVHALISAKADLYLKNEMGKTPVEDAEANGHTAACRVLTQHMRGSQSISMGQIPESNGQYGSSDGVRYNSAPSGFSSVQTSLPPASKCNNMSQSHHMPNTAAMSQSRPTSDSYVRYSPDFTGFTKLHLQQDIKENVEHVPPCDTSGVPGGVDRNGAENGYCCFREQPVAVQTTEKAEICYVDDNHVLLRRPGGRIAGDNENRMGMQFSSADLQGLPSPIFSSAAKPRPTRSSISCVQDATKQHREAVEQYAETLQLEMVKYCEQIEELQKSQETAKLIHQQQLQQLALERNRSHEENALLRSALETAQKNHKEKENQFSTVIKQFGRRRETVINTSGYSGNHHSHKALLKYLKSVSPGDSAWRSPERALFCLKEQIVDLWLTWPLPSVLDTPNKEWIPGADYVLIGDSPINHYDDGQRDGSCSLVFRIRHKKGKQYILKMMINLLNLNFTKHGEGYSTDGYLIQNFGPEYDIPVRLRTHPNVVKILHHYDGGTDRFKKFMKLLIPSEFDVPIEMANRTTFLVMEEFSMTLKSFMLEQRTTFPEANYGLDCAFLLQLLYQLLSAVYYLQRNSVVHRDIKADNVFLDNYLRPVLGDFGFARRLQGLDGKPITFKNQHEVCAGNAHAWAPELCRYNRTGPTVEKKLSLEEVYSKTDAFGVSRMFYSLLRPLGDGDSFPQSSINMPNYNNADIPELPVSFPAGFSYILRQLVLNDPADRLTARKAMLSVGMLLFTPSSQEMTSESDVSVYCQAQMLKLLALEKTRRAEQTKLSMSESITVVGPELEADFLHNITPAEFWEIYQGLQERHLLPAAE